MNIEVFTDVLESAGDRPIRVLARVSVHRTDEGGRHGPFTSGYRPNHNFGGPMDRVFFIGQVDVPDDAWVQPGETRDLVVTFLNVRGLSDLLRVGRSWRFQEGLRHVATAELLAIIPEA